MLPYVLPMCDIPLYRDTDKASRVRPRTGPQGQYQDLQGRGLYPQGQGLGPSRPRSGIFEAEVRDLQGQGLDPKAKVKDPQGRGLYPQGKG